MEDCIQTKEIFDEAFGKHQRRRAATTTPLHEHIHRQLIERLADLKEKPAPFTDFQALSPVFTQELTEQGYKEGQAPYGLILSVLQLQSMNNLPAILKAFHTSLKTDGLFLASILGGNTLHELRTCLIDAETEISGGARPRVIPMIEQETASRYLIKAGFAHSVLDHERITMTYFDIWGLMKALRMMGLTNGLKDRPHHFTQRKLFERAGAIYAARFPTGSGGITATFDVLYMHGWKEK